MTTEQRVAALWEILREEFGIETTEQFEEAYSQLRPIDISAFVPPGAHHYWPERGFPPLKIPLRR